MWTSGNEEHPDPEHLCLTENDVSQVLGVQRPTVTCALWMLTLLQGKRWLELPLCQSRQ